MKSLFLEGWHKKNRHFKKIMKLFITVPICEYIFTHHKEPDVSRSGNSENSIKLVRSWEGPRYGLRTTEDLQDRLETISKNEVFRANIIKNKNPSLK